MPRTAKKVTVSKRATTKKAKTVTRARKSPIDKINTTISKWDLETGVPDHIKLATVDYLSLLASTLEREEGLSLNYIASCGSLTVLPKKPKELLSTVKYLKRLASK